MRIPDRIDIHFHQLEFKEMITAWHQKANEIMLQYGIYIEVKYELGDGAHLRHLYFKALDREFENLNELIRVINNKAFL